MAIHILIAISDDQFSHVLKLFLTTEGFKVSQVQDGENAFLFIKEQSINAFIVDTSLLKMSGDTVISLLRKDQVDTPALLLITKSPVFTGITFKPLTPYILYPPFHPEKIIEMLLKMMA